MKTVCCLGKLLFLGIALCGPAYAQHLTLSTLANQGPYTFRIIGGTPGQYGHTDGVGTNAVFGPTTGLATDREGNLYIVDGFRDGQTIRKMTPDGMVSTLAGKSGDTAEVDGMGGEARFHSPHGITVAGDRNLYVTDSFGQTIRRVTPQGVVTTLAGFPFVQGNVDGIGSNARFHGPIGITHDNRGNLYVAEETGHTIRRVTLAGEVTTIAGMFLAQGTNDGIGIAARFRYPKALTMGKDGNIYVADHASIRKVTPEGRVSTLTRGFSPLDIAADSHGNLYVLQWPGSVTRGTPEGVISPVVGEDGQPYRFNFWSEYATIAISKENHIYVGESGNAVILKADATSNRITFFVTLSTPDPFSGVMAVVEASMDFNNWLPIQTGQVYSGLPMPVFDNTTPFPHRFYRARRQ